MMKKFIFGQFSAFTFLLVIAFAGAAQCYSFSDAAVSYVEDALITDEAKTAITGVISNDVEADEWLTVSDNVLYSLCVKRVPDIKNRKPAVIKTIERDSMRLAVMRAETNIALYLDKGRLNRKVYSDKEAADFALRTSYLAGLKGVQSSANIINKQAVGLVSVSLKDNNIEHIGKSLSGKVITENYCSYLYKKAHNFFNKGDYGKALETFRQIHFMAWANVNAYLGASICFLKMDKPEDASKLASEVFSVLSKDMTPDETASVGRILFRTGDKDKGFAILERAYKMLKTSK